MQEKEGGENKFVAKRTGDGVLDGAESAADFDEEIDEKVCLDRLLSEVMSTSKGPRQLRLTLEEDDWDF
jgi:hypothetical protein